MVAVVVPWNQLDDNDMTPIHCYWKEEEEEEGDGNYKNRRQNLWESQEYCMVHSLQNNNFVAVVEAVSVDVEVAVAVMMMVVV